MKAEPARQRRAALEEIEPRILYSADFAAGLVDTATITPAAEQRIVEPTGEFIQTIQDAQTRRHEIVFVDPATPDHDKLIEAIRARDSERTIEVVLLDASKDSVKQISDTLAACSDISAVHLVSHGSDGVVQLGSFTLDFDSLLKHATQIKGWGNALASEADLLIYGCGVAQHADGKALVDALARLTGADVAASDDLTGSAAKRGDWDLEYRTGAIETRVAVSATTQQYWQHLLPNSAPTDIGTGASATIANPGFESAVLADSDTTTTITGWAKSGSQMGVYNVAAADYPAEAPEGQNVAYIGNDGTISQVLSDTFQASRSYMLKTFVGDALANGTNVWQVRLYAGTQLLGSMSNADFNPPDGTFIEAALSLNASSLAGFSAYYGQALKVELYDSVASANVHFDHVRLTFFDSTVIGSVAENVANGTVVVSALNVLDPDPSDTHTFTLVDSAGGRFAINSSTGAITVANGALLDYESATSHNVTLRATDNGLLTYDEVVTINLLDVNDAPTGVPTISGIPTEDQTLSADTSTIADVDGLGVFSYQWARSPDAGATWSTIAGATAGTYNLGDADVGNLIQVSVGYTDGQGSAEGLTSASVGPVADVNDAPVLTANSLRIGQGATVILSGANLGASDVDNAPAALSFTVSNVANGRFELRGAPGVVITSFTQGEVAAGLVVFVHDGSAIAPSYEVTVSDGALTEGPLLAGISFDPSAVVMVPLLPSEPVPLPLPVVDEPPIDEPAPSQSEAPAQSEREGVATAVFSPGRPDEDPPEPQLNGLDNTRRVVRLTAHRPVATLNHFTPQPHIDPTVQLLAAAPANLAYVPSVPVDWTTRPAFPDAEETPRDRNEVLLEQVQLSGMALSVGVVWWASRISGLLGTLLASAPAWRHIDPLPVVGGDEDEERNWYDPEDRDADADELAISDVLEEARAAGDEQQS